ncbi:MAG: PRC-barrel domain-containing protein [Hyphomicrobiales bacterium]|nr:PRC-barrel domain-containing protein [Hyphomicrobiales bacterium]
MTDYTTTRSDQSVATDETSQLIAATKVNGTYVYNRQGENLGSVYDLMIDKRSGHVAYAIMSFGGFLGMGESYHPLPWNVLDYDERQGGYVIDMDADRLRNAPSFRLNETPDWSDRSYGRRIDEYYGVPGRPF